MQMQDELFRKLRKSTLVNTSGATYTDFRKTLIPRWGLVWLHIGLGWGALLLTAGGILVLSGRSLLIDVLLVGAGSLLMGYILAYLQLFFHEAAHYNLHPNRGVNDVLCNVFVSGIVGQDIKKYRPIHWEHHKHLGTTADSEISYFDPLNIKLLVTSLLGIRALNVMRMRKKLSDSKAKQQKKVANQTRTLCTASWWLR